MFDAHAHFLPDSYRAFLEKRDFSKAIGIAVPHWSPKSHAEFNDRFGIETAVLSLSDPGAFLPALYDTRADALRAACRWARETNDAAAAAIADHPGRFAAVATVPLPDVDGALAELDRALDELALDGVVLLSNYEGRYLGDQMFDPILRELDRRAATVLVHPTLPACAPSQPYPIVILEFPYETARTVASLLRAGAFERYPRIRFQVPHCGGTLPVVYEAITRGPEDVDLLRHQLWFDTAQAPTVEQLAPTRAFAGAHRVLAGTDWPWAAYQFEGRNGTPQPMLAEVFDQAELVAVEYDNASALYPSLSTT